MCRISGRWHTDTPKNGAVSRPGRDRRWDPAGVHYGAHVAVIGNLKTFNIGGGFHVVKACLLDVSPQAMIRAALEKYPDAVIPPRGKKIRQVKPREVDDGPD
jgi:hypothetical protein